MAERIPVWLSVQHPSRVRRNRPRVAVGGPGVDAGARPGLGAGARPGMGAGAGSPALGFARPGQRPDRAGLLGRIERDVLGEPAETLQEGARRSRPDSSRHRHAGRPPRRTAALLHSCTAACTPSGIRPRSPSPPGRTRAAPRSPALIRRRRFPPTCSAGQSLVAYDRIAPDLAAEARSGHGHRARSGHGHRARSERDRRLPRSRHRPSQGPPHRRPPPPPSRTHHTPVSWSRGAPPTRRAVRACPVPCPVRVPRCRPVRPARGRRAVGCGRYSGAGAAGGRS